MSQVILRGKNIWKSFDGVHALKDIDIEIEKGKIICLAGENGCGKSTLVKILSGVYQPSRGTIEIEGQEYSHLSPIKAIENGIQVIYQDLSLFPHMTVGENIAMNHMVRSKEKFIDRHEIDRVAREQLEKIGANLDINMPVRNLSIANKQLVAIARALSLDTKILFMDEPTTALTKKEVAKLLDIVLGLKEKGISIVFISHKLNEVFEISDQITVIRDGVKVGDFKASSLDPKSLSFHMTGREIGHGNYRKYEETENVLRLKALSKKDNYESIDLEVNRGDIVGITGLLGSGRTELALSIFGLNKPDSGLIEIGGRPVEIGSPVEALKNSIALLPEDRLSQGLFLESSEKVNISSTILNKIKGKLGVLNFKKEAEIAKATVDKVNVNNKNIELEVKNLSGGNQQKIVLGKWMVTHPDLFILDAPTVGVDIGSKEEIYEQIQASARGGMGLILISDEIEEIMANCNKLVIMHEGKIIKRLDQKDLDRPGVEEEIFELINNSYGGGELE